MKKTFVFWALLAAIFSLLGCGGGDGGEDWDSINPLGIGIDDPTDSGGLTLPSHVETLIVGGFVLESPYGKNSETGCFCGLACLEYPYNPGCYYTMYWPGVDVTVTNQTNGEAILASIDYDCNAPRETSYRWTASIPLVVGTNRILARSDDGMGNRGSDVLTVSNP